MKDKKHCQEDSTLYPVTVISNPRNGSQRVQIHYIGYGSRYDEWRDRDDIVPIPCLTMEKFDLNQELVFKIKSSLLGNRKSNPVIRLTMPFDLITFNEGLGVSGHIVRTVRKIDYIKIRRYEELNPVLGPNWHFRGVNAVGDYSYVILDSVEYYLYRRRGIAHYIPDDDNKPLKTVIPCGYMLSFRFVSGDGTPSEFGTNTNIFSQHNS